MRGVSRSGIGRLISGGCRLLPRGSLLSNTSRVEDGRAAADGVEIDSCLPFPLRDKIVGTDDTACEAETGFREVVDRAVEDWGCTDDER